jgi:hypothetical protein
MVRMMGEEKAIPRFDRAAAEVSAAREWDATHKKETERLKSLKPGLVVPPLVNR